MVLYAAISPASQTGKFGLYAGLMLAVFSVFELTAIALAASYASKGETNLRADSHRVQGIFRPFSSVFLCVYQPKN